MVFLCVCHLSIRCIAPWPLLMFYSSCAIKEQRKRWAQSAWVLPTCSCKTLMFLCKSGLIFCFIIIFVFLFYFILFESPENLFNLHPSPHCKSLCNRISPPVWPSGQVAKAVERRSVWVSHCPVSCARGPRELIMQAGEPSSGHFNHYTEISLLTSSKKIYLPLPAASLLPTKAAETPPWTNSSCTY